MFMTRSRNALSRNGTRVSTPQAKGALLARSTSHWWSRFSSRTVSLERWTTGDGQADALVAR